MKIGGIPKNLSANALVFRQLLEEIICGQAMPFDEIDKEEGALPVRYSHVRTLSSHKAFSSAGARTRRRRPRGIFDMVREPSRIP